MGAVVLDSGVLIGFFETTDAHHQGARAALSKHEAEELVLPASAYAEVLIRPSSRGAVDSTRAAIRSLGILIADLKEPAAEAAAGLRARHPSLRLPDALVLGHAEAIGADVVLTTDRRWKRVDPRVQVV